MDQTWHPEHFVCAQCGKAFGESGYHEKDGKPYCRDDYYGLFAPKCSGCDRAIMDNYISALNGHWHPECFVCMVSCSFRIPHFWSTPDFFRFLYLIYVPVTSIYWYFSVYLINISI